MLDQSLMKSLSAAISQAEGRTIRVEDARAISGGDINKAYSIGSGEQRFFAKFNEESDSRNFESEAVSLDALAETGTVRVPRVICLGRWGSINYLILEYIPMHTQVGAALGQQLARLHRVSAASFGWQVDNFIGRTPQYNAVKERWAEFFAEQRIAPQVALANRNDADLESPEVVAGWVVAALKGHQPSPSLLHGDLWCGNAALSDNAEPVIFDPASYYGDRETDLAMTRLFGGFSADFYTAYESVWPLPASAPQRVGLYQLYHLLNHYNLFGGHYLQRSKQLLDQLATEFA